MFFWKFYKFLEYLWATTYKIDKTFFQMRDNLTNSKRKYFWLDSLVGWVVTVESRFNFVKRLPLTSGSKIDNNNVNNYDQFSRNIESSPVIYQANQIAGFYMIWTLGC